MRAGFVFLARDRMLRTLAVAWVAAVVGMGLAMVADVPLVEHFGAGSIGYGLLITSWGGGSVLGSFAGRYLTADKEPWALFFGMALIAVSTAAISVSPWFAPILVVVFGAGVGDAVTLVAEQGIQQRRAPDAVRSRVMAATEGIATLSFVVGLAFAGAALRIVGPQGAYAVAGATAAVGAMVLVPILRRRSEPVSVDSVAETVSTAVEIG